jgi:galactokinase
LNDLKPGAEGWPNYILGVADQLQKRGYELGGFNLVIDGDVPLGAGLSSSAAVECATVLALSGLFGVSIPRMQIVQIAQKAEHHFAGVHCGIMDQFASMLGRKNYALKLDCKTLEYEYVPLKMEGVKIVLFNTNVKHSLSSSEYNTRRQQCEQGVAWIRDKYPHVTSLRYATLELINEVVQQKDAIIYRRCKYVVEENMRLLEACEDLKKGNLKALGEKMFQTHEGLSKDYEVSCRELDFLTEAVNGNTDVLGARMMGGGFGGCTINLVKEEAIDALVERLSNDYKAATGLKLSVYITQIKNGTQRIFENNIINV